MNSVSIVTLSIIVLFYSLDSYADEVCSKPERVNMKKMADLVVANSPYSVGICYLPEVVKKGMLADHQELIVFNPDFPLDLYCGWSRG